MNVEGDIRKSETFYQLIMIEQSEKQVETCTELTRQNKPIRICMYPGFDGHIGP